MKTKNSIQWYNSYLIGLKYNLKVQAVYFVPTFFIGLLVLATIFISLMSLHIIFVSLSLTTTLFYLAPFYFNTEGRGLKLSRERRFTLDEGGQIIEFVDGIENHWKITPSSRVSFLGAWLTLEKIKSKEETPIISPFTSPENSAQKLQSRSVFIPVCLISNQERSRLFRITTKILSARYNSYSEFNY